MKLAIKLLEARRLIKETKTSKEGKNDFSKYDYFTPSQVSQLVNDVCQKLKMIPLFSLRKDEYGLFGRLRIIDLENEKDGNPLYIETEMRTEMPKITATNETQQMGGCETYTKRYMLMSAFDITDNNLDFDSQDNRPKPDKVEAEITVCTTMEQLQEVWGKLTEKQQTKYVTIFTTRKKQISIS